MFRYLLQLKKVFLLAIFTFGGSENEIFSFRLTAFIDQLQTLSSSWPEASMKMKKTMNTSATVPEM